MSKRTEVDSFFFYQSLKQRIRTD